MCWTCSLLVVRDTGSIRQSKRYNKLDELITSATLPTNTTNESDEFVVEFTNSDGVDFDKEEQDIIITLEEDS